MTEDEAFIRAVVDGPGDDTVRLVYADWLDDRADPRGPYLRAEFEWAMPWRNGERPTDNLALRERAARLDPMWVARISDHRWACAANTSGLKVVARLAEDFATLLSNLRVRQQR